MALLALAACGSDSDSDSKSTEPAVTSPEDHLATDAEVTAGLGRMAATAATITATVAAGTKVEDAQDQLEVDWQQVEGTVRANEPDLYLEFEEDLGAIDKAAADANAADTAKSIGDLATVTASYLSKHP
ncbi:MAG: hypothetical protein JWN99_2293 [Ilumatobacteraceae bacterium]|nr:hypothetical protein [Ilumatobacteraceae bacterium]